MASPNQVTGYDPESLQIIQMDTAQTETPLPTEEEYLKDMVRVWRGRKNTAVASRDARAPAAKQQAASRPQQAQGKNAPSVASQHAKQLQWRPKNTPRIEEDDIIVVLKPRETLDHKATFGPGQADAAVRSILGADTAVASRDARAPAAKQQAASRPQQAQGKNAPSVASQHAKQLQWRPKNTPRIEEDDIIVVLKPRETLDLKATFGPGQAGAAVRSIPGADASVGLAVWPPLGSKFTCVHAQISGRRRETPPGH
ncbi:hypothetical protein MRX96_048012 [Rhipicephalus microplus]